MEKIRKVSTVKGICLVVLVIFLGLGYQAFASTVMPAQIADSESGCPCEDADTMEADQIDEDSRGECQNHDLHLDHGTTGLFLIWRV